MFDLKPIPPSVIKIIKSLQDNGKQGFLVGGSVRDLLLGVIPFEWDLATSARPEEVQAWFEKVVPTGIDFGTVTVIIQDEKFEVTTFRRDQRYIDGRRPSKVIFSESLKEDLSRRDFTINAMAYDPVNDRLIDEFKGREDLKKKIIRTVGDPDERFSEDGLRPIRACRFAAQLDFKIEGKTLAAVKKSLAVVKKVSIERVHDELVKMLTRSPRPSVGFECMRESGLLEIFLPELLGCKGVTQPKAFHKYDVYYHSIYSCDAAPEDNLTVRLAALLHDIEKPSCNLACRQAGEGDHFYGHDQQGAKTAGTMLKRLKFSSEIIDKTVNLIKNHMFNYESNWTDSAVRRFVVRVGPENLDDLFLLRRADTKAMEKEINSDYLTELKNRIDKIIEEKNALHVSGLKINGGDVMRLFNIPPGPRVGKILNWLLEKVLDDPSLNQKDKLIELLKKYEN